MNHGRLVVLFSDCLMPCGITRLRETLVFITTAIVSTVAEIESGSIFHETCLSTEV